MTAGSSVVKITAKTALKDKWLKAIVSGMILVFGFILCSNISSLIGIMAGNIMVYIVFGLFIAFMIFPLFLGEVRFFWRLIFGAEDNPVSVFYYFSSKDLYLRAIRLSLDIALKMLIIGAVLFAPSAIVNMFAGTQVYDLIDIPIPIWTSNLYYISVFLRAIAFVCLIFVMVRYYIAPVLVVADDNMEVAEAIHMSIKISKSTSFEFLYLLLSMCGWVLISVLVVPLVFTLPYFMTSLVVHVRFCVADYNKKIEKSDIDNYPTFVAGV